MVDLWGQGPIDTIRKDTKMQKGDKAGGKPAWPAPATNEQIRDALLATKLEMDGLTDGEINS